ncbi:hypothetical protein GCM10009677_08450 [Sphaerisporangium rubeum]
MNAGSAAAAALAALAGIAANARNGRTMARAIVAAVPRLERCILTMVDALRHRAHVRERGDMKAFFPDQGGLSGKARAAALVAIC